MYLYIDIVFVSSKRMLQLQVVYSSSLYFRDFGAITLIRAKLDNGLVKLVKLEQIHSPLQLTCLPYDLPASLPDLPSGATNPGVPQKVLVVSLILVLTGQNQQFLHSLIDL